ncbi:MAG: hypothetical protein R3320_11160 [Nitriliruptorales bacterium]|nr:hypothetical protein [Nitriliruptorales bacterium]
MSTTTPPPDLDLGSVDLLALERRFQQALAAGDAGALPVVGYGEISVTFGWPPANPRIAVKSLPVFEDLDRLRAYAALVEGYIDRLRDRRVHVLPTAVRWSRAPGGWRGYLLQPLLPQGSIGPRVLAHGGP